ncbi:MAG: hypothetical protein AAF447_07890, partial [Myxococcota bacterium]
AQHLVEGLGFGLTLDGHALEQTSPAALSRATENLSLGEGVLRALRSELEERLPRVLGEA